VLNVCGVNVYGVFRDRRDGGDMYGGGGRGMMSERGG